MVKSVVSLTVNNEIATQVRSKDLRQEPISNTKKVCKNTVYGSALKKLTIRSVTSGPVPRAYLSATHHHNIAVALRRCSMDLPLGQDIVVLGKIPSPSFFKNRVVQTNADVLKLGAIIYKKKRGRDSTQASSHPSRDEDDTWGSEYIVNTEGYDKAMIPPKVLRRLLADAAGALTDSDAPPSLACMYIPTSFRPHSAHTPAPADRLNSVNCAFKVYRFFALTPTLARRCAAAGRPAVGKFLPLGVGKLKAADCPGPYFMVALPDAGVGDSDSGEDDAAEAAPACGATAVKTAAHSDSDGTVRSVGPAGDLPSFSLTLGAGAWARGSAAPPPGRRGVMTLPPLVLGRSDSDAAAQSLRSTAAAATAAATSWLILRRRRIRRRRRRQPGPIRALQRRLHICLRLQY
jgi:hypothetical protein